MDPYRVLGLKHGASDSEIKKAFHDAAKKCHPDKNPDDIQAEERFKEISQAYEILSNGSISIDTPLRGDNFSLDEILSELFSNPFKKEGASSDFPDLEDSPEILNIRVPLDTALEGGRVIVPYGSERLRIQIPPGTHNGQRLRLKGVAAGGEDVIVHVYVD